MTAPNEAPPFEHLSRCPHCQSAVFYDWGLELLDHKPVSDLRGGENERYRNWTEGNRIKICARCNTPFVIYGGELIDVSAELGAEEIKMILTRGQATLPHPKIKDP